MAFARPITERITQGHLLRFDDPGPLLEDLYAPGAVFDDPAGTIRGPKGIVAGFAAIKAVFSAAEHLPERPGDGPPEWTFHPRLVGSERNTFVLCDDAAGGDPAGKDGIVQVPSQARLRVRTRYTVRGVGWTFTLPSTIVLSFDESNRIALHEDRWFHAKPVFFPGHGALKRLHGAAFVALFARKG